MLWNGLLQPVNCEGTGHGLAQGIAVQSTIQIGMPAILFTVIACVSRLSYSYSNVDIVGTVHLYFLRE